MAKKFKVFVGVSGGVDSSVALALLKQQGYDVTGVFLKVWHPEFLPCDWKEERRSAMRVCATLGVPFLTFDFEIEYKKEVVDYMLQEYASGRVPNPDVFCNKFVKFGVFLDKAREMGADYIATGHYAQKTSFSSNSSRSTHKISGEIFAHSRLPASESLRDEHESKKFPYCLLESTDKNKDQSYFLYTLNQKQLSHTLFPVGGITKPEVRKLAKKFGLLTAEKKDSQGLCFIGKVDMKDFLTHYIKTEKGDVINIKGKVVGRHDGAMLYTIGQRHGFEITLKTPNDNRFFVIAKDLVRNTITVADKESDVASVYSIKEIIVSNLHFISDKEPKLPMQTSARIRYRQDKQNCILSNQADGYHITFKTPQNAVAVGQSAVLYDGDVCLGGGIIEKVIVE